MLEYLHTCVTKQYQPVSGQQINYININSGNIVSCAVIKTFKTFSSGHIKTREEHMFRNIYNYNMCSIFEYDHLFINIALQYINNQNYNSART